MLPALPEPLLLAVKLAPSFSSTGNSVAIESLELAHEGVERA